MNEEDNKNKNFITNISQQHYLLENDDKDLFFDDSDEFK